MKKPVSLFEKLVLEVIRLYSHPITFLIAGLVAVTYFIITIMTAESLKDILYSLITCTIFLSLFIVQKAANRDILAIHIKMNELVKSHEAADSDLAKIEEKSEAELKGIVEENS